MIARIRKRGMIAGMITNGYLLVADRIKRLNQAGLDHLQISIDNVMPDEISKKSLKVLDKKLQVLSEHAEFHVNINSVVGGGIHNPQDALVYRAARALNWASRRPSALSTMAAASCSPWPTRERKIYMRDALDGKNQLLAHQLFPGQHRPRQRESTGAAAPARVISISARTAWCITARSSAAIPASRCWNTPSPISSANTAPPKAAPRAARWPACTRFRTSISGAANRTSSARP